MTTSYELYKLDNARSVAEIAGMPATRLEFSTQALDAWEPILVKNKKTSKEMAPYMVQTMRERNYSPWAIIAFPEDYPLMGYLFSLRENRNDFRFTGYGIPPDYVPACDGKKPVGIVLIGSKQILSQLAQKSPMFVSAWEELKNKSEEHPWLCLSDSPPGEWLDKQIKEDEKLFRGSIGK